MKLLKILILNCVLISYSVATFAADLKVTKLGERFTILSSQLRADSYVNAIFYQDGNELIAIDSTASQGEDLVDYAKNRLKMPIKMLINTHHHGDHVGGNAAFKEVETIASSQGTYDRLKANQVTALPNKILKDKDTIKTNHSEIELTTYAGGHSGSDTTLYFKDENVIVIADLMFLGRFPFIDQKSGGDLLSYFQNNHRILQLINDDTTVISGHAMPVSKKEYATYIDLLEQMVAQVKTLKAQGKSLDDIIQADILADYSDMAWRMMNEDQFVTSIYHYLEGVEK